MTTRNELLESEVRTANEQLYESYKRIMVLNDRIDELEKENTELRTIAEKPGYDFIDRD